MRRRDALGLLGGALLAACAPPRPPAPLRTEADLRLGWRFVPGQQLTYRIVTTRQTPTRRTVRSERWAYRVVSVDAWDIAVLHGRLVGIGGAVRRDGIDVPDQALDPALEAARHRGDQVRLSLGHDGLLYPSEGSACGPVGPPSADCFGPHLAHRLLAVPLPHRPVGPGDRWRDPELADALAALLPDDPPPVTTGQVDVWHLSETAGPSPRLLLGTTASARSAAGADLRAEGRIAWDPLRGVLAERFLGLRALGGALAEVGELTLTLTLVA